MTGYNFAAKTALDGRAVKAQAESGAELFILCEPSDMDKLMDVWGWDEDTIYECTNLDETVRYTSYNGYDFISLIHLEASEGTLIQREINIFMARRYLVFIMPTSACANLRKLAKTLTDAIPAAMSRGLPLLYLYYLILDGFATDFSDILEGLEDEMEALSESIEAQPDGDHSAAITRNRKTAYMCKKLIRALSNIGGQILMDDNDLMDEAHERYFRNIDARFIRLYGFADNLFDLSQGLVHLYDSKLSAQTNETVNKLTVITVFFAPLTVIAGIYGMNFAHMPELSWQWGYPAALLLMVAVSGVIMFVLKKKKWF